MPEHDHTIRPLTWTVYATPLMPYLRLEPVHTCLYVRACRLVWPLVWARARLVDLTERCYSEEDSQGFLQFLVFLSLGYPLSVSIKTLLSKNGRKEKVVTVKEQKKASSHMCIARAKLAWCYILKNKFGRKIHRKSPVHSCILQVFASTGKVHRLDLPFLYILTSGTYTKLVRKNWMPVLFICFPQLCSSVGRRFVMSRSCSTFYWPVGSFPQNWIRGNAVNLDSSENLCLLEKYPTQPSGRF